MKKNYDRRRVGDLVQTQGFIPCAQCGREERDAEMVIRALGNPDEPQTDILVCKQCASR